MHALLNYSKHNCGLVDVTGFPQVVVMTKDDQICLEVTTKTLKTKGHSMESILKLALLHKERLFMATQLS